MAHEISFLGLVTVYICCCIRGNMSRNFPLNGCSSDDMDVMCLYFENTVYNGYNDEKDLCRQFVKDLINIPSNKTSPRVMFADVVDRFSVINPSINVSSWRLHSSLVSELYGKVEQKAKRRRFKIGLIIERKVKFVQRLFSEMDGVREDATHIAVIFLDGAGLSYKDTRIVSHFVHHQDTDIKIFVVVLGVDFDTDILLLNDTLLVAHQIKRFPNGVLTVAICHQCMDGWWSFDHKATSDTLTCYKLLDFNVKIDRYSAQIKCIDEYGGSLVAIESVDELNFLRAKMYSHFTKLGHGDTNGSHTVPAGLSSSESNQRDIVSGDSSQPENVGEFRRPTTDGRLLQTFGIESMTEGDGEFSADVFIGLYRDWMRVTSRFKWEWKQPFLHRPVTVNNWSPGKPHGSGCGVWRFIWGDRVTGVTNLSRPGVTGVTNLFCPVDNFVDGWAEVQCRDELRSLSLCEVVRPRRIDSKSLMKINPASRESFSRALAKGDFVQFGGNIVSVSANIANRDFRTFFEQSGQEMFPLFDCGQDSGNHRYIAYVYVCDHTNHCSNNRDEESCLFDTIDISIEVGMEYNMWKCDGFYCCDGSCLPLQWVNDGEVDCFDCENKFGNRINDESEVLNKYLKRNVTCAFICNNQVCVHFSELNDGEVDCNGQEGPLDETIGKLETADSCYNILGHIIWAPKCVYVRDIYGAVLGCRDMSHLEDCTKFICPEGYFKCLNTYCVPQHYVLDGIVDCPTGEDEQFGIIEQCYGNFACWNSRMCLHPDLVCNEHPDCPHQDDEVDCGVYCDEGFRCVSMTVTVSNYNVSIPLEDVSFLDIRTKYLDMSGLDVSLVKKDFAYHLIDARFIKWSNCKIINLSEMFGYSSRVIQELDVSYNLIRSLDGSDIEFLTLQNIRLLNLSYNIELVDVSYLQFQLLENLDLSHTGLSRLEESVLLWLPNLKHLDLSYTYITDLSTNTFPSNCILQTLKLRGLDINHIYEDIFNGLTISQHLYTDSSGLCCPQIRGENIADGICHTSEDSISSCFDMLKEKAQRALLWAVAVTAVLWNMIVVVYRVIWDRSVLRTGYGLFVTNLGISDFIMGVYLFIIAGADYYYRGIYILYDKTWRESIVCRLAGFLATLSCETSTFFVLLITLDRFLVMKFPFGQIRFSKINKIVCLLLSWLIGFLLALIPIVFNFEIYSSTAVCLGLPLTTKQLYGWTFSFGVFIVLNFLLSLIIVYGQRAIFGAISESRITGTKLSTSSRREKDIMVVKQLFLVALSNFLCWFPIGIMGLVSVSGYAINNDIYAWTTVIVLPINSAANPLLYTIPAILARWEQFKHGTQKVHK